MKRRPDRNPSPRPGRARGAFTLVELLVVVAIILILMGLVLAVLPPILRQRQILLATKQVHDLAGAAAQYARAFVDYLPDTGAVDSAGNTSAFTADDPAVADSLARYLTLSVVDPVTGQAGEPFYPDFPARQIQTTGAGLRLLMDPWGRPYLMDARHASVKTDPVTGDVQVTRVGEPYHPTANPADPNYTPPPERTVEVKVWSLGPDGKGGPLPFSHVKTATDPADVDHIGSW
jgi:prepilin-type N-terminal cleavage/methylation domain-containing protein